MIGERVRLARDYLGMTQAALAYRAGITQSAISQIERGGPPSVETLQAISEATNYKIDFFVRGALPDLPALSLRYRRSASLRMKDDRRLRAHCRQGVELVAELENHVKLPHVTLDPVRGRIDDHDIEKIAVVVRQHLGIGPDDPIPNLIRAAERGGVVVFGASVDINNVDAASVWSDSHLGRPIVCFTRGRSGDRQRLSLAHELGHLILHKDRRVEPERAEAEAFRFAGALLIPEAAAQKDLETPVLLSNLAWTKGKWGMSIAALIRRAFDLHIIDSHRYQSLMKQLSARGWRKAEPVDVMREKPSLLAEALCRAFGTDQPVPIAARTGLSPMAVRDLVA